MLGPGVAVNIPEFLREREELMDRGVPQPQLRVSDRAQVVVPYHVLLDEYEEERLGDHKFGSTKAGIAPFYSDKYMKLGVQVADLSDSDRLRERLGASLAAKNVLLEHLYHKPTMSADDLLDQLLDQGRRIEPFVCDTVSLVGDALAQGTDPMGERRPFVPRKVLRPTRPGDRFGRGQWHGPGEGPGHAPRAVSRPHLLCPLQRRRLGSRAHGSERSGALLGEDAQRRDARGDRGRPAAFGALALSTVGGRRALGVLLPGPVKPLQAYCRRLLPAGREP